MHTEQSQKGNLPAMTTGESDAWASMLNPTVVEKLLNSEGVGGGGGNTNPTHFNLHGEPP